MTDRTCGFLIVQLSHWLHCTWAIRSKFKGSKK